MNEPTRSRKNQQIWIYDWGELREKAWAVPELPFSLQDVYRVSPLYSLVKVVLSFACQQ